MMVVSIVGHVMTRLLVVVVFLLSGCTSLQPPEAPETLPQLVYQVPLPPWPTSAVDRDITLDLKIYVNSDGSVRDAVLLTPSGFRNWDASALQEIRKWRFSPAVDRGKPIPLWIRQTVRIHFEVPMFMPLAEFVCTGAALADSVYRLLKSGEPFELLAKQFSVVTSRERGGVLGKVDVRTFPAEIRRELAKLRDGEFTGPLVLGQRYIIYKRLARGIEARVN